jgi:hypothetical protein
MDGRNASFAKSWPYNQSLGVWGRQAPSWSPPFHFFALYDSAGCGLGLFKSTKYWMDWMAAI